jgi:hypothetical protein
MIEAMLRKIKPHLPLKISEVIWESDVFRMHGKGWNFVTTSAWRVSTENKVILGCYDYHSDTIHVLNQIKNLHIVDIWPQTESLKIDPVFLLSNQQKIEIFSAGIHKPWSLQIDPLPIFIATPGEPDTFDNP